MTSQQFRKGVRTFLSVAALLASGWWIWTVQRSKGDFVPDAFLLMLQVPALVIFAISVGSLGSTLSAPTKQSSVPVEVQARHAENAVSFSAIFGKATPFVAVFAVLLSVIAGALLLS